MPDLDAAPSVRRTFALHFFAALLPLALLKTGLVLHRAAQVASIEPPWVSLPKLLLFLGGDITCAAVVAVLAVITAQALRIRRPGWHAAVTAPLHLINGVFAAFSTLCVVELGGPVTKQLIEATFQVISHWTNQMGASSDDYLKPENLALMAFCGLAGPVFVYWGLVRGRNFNPKGSRVRVLVTLLLLEAILTVGVVPFMASGEIGVRMRTDETECTPWGQLVSSYARPVLRRLFASEEKGALGFKFDLRSSLPDSDKPVSTVLTTAVPKKTNVLIVLMESIGLRYLSDPADPMPYVRHLPDNPDVVTFDSHYATWSLTTQVLFSILCSELPYPSYQSISFVNPSIPCVTLTEHLHDRGYFTALVTAGDLDFDQKKRFLRGRKLDITWDATTMPHSEGAWHGPWGLEDAVSVPNVLEAAKQAGDKPFFIIFNQLAGHHPFIATEAQAKNPKPERYDNYIDSLRVADTVTRDAIEGLRAMGKLEDTLVVVVSDHGEGHGRFAGRNIWEPVVRVPMYLFGPQTKGHGGHLQITTSQLDLGPTLLGLLGVDIPCTMKGRDLTKPAEPRISIYGGRPPHFQIGLTDGHWKYILEDGETDMLFDLNADPDETENIAVKEAAVTANYRHRMEAWRFQSADLIESYAQRMQEAGCQP